MTELILILVIVLLLVVTFFIIRGNHKREKELNGMIDRKEAEIIAMKRSIENYEKAVKKLAGRKKENAEVKKNIDAATGSVLANLINSL